MKAKVGVLIVAGALALAGCQRMVGGTGAAHGRYLGVGVYPAGQMWSQIAGPAPTDPKAATLNDDEQVIVVVDSRTGEIRQCGNLSGYCVAMNPWARPAAQGTPAALAKHAAQIAAEAASGAKPQPPP